MMYPNGASDRRTPMASTIEYAAIMKPVPSAKQDAAVQGAQAVAPGERQAHDSCRYEDDPGQAAGIVFALQQKYGKQRDEDRGAAPGDRIGA